MILLAFDKFRGAMRANELAAVAEQAIRHVQAQASVQTQVLSDGGEGFLTALDAHVEPAMKRVFAPARDAGGHWRARAEYRLDAARKTAWIETSLASGWDSFAQGRASPKHPMTYATWGTGDLARHAIQQGAERIVLGLGGSCSTDGGLGALEALGYQFFDEAGKRLEAGGGTLQHLHRVKAPVAQQQQPAWVLACDVQHRYAEAAAAFGPQKGANPEQVRQLSAGLVHAGSVLSAFGRRPILDRAMTGSCGGLAGGLHAVLGASLVPGFDCIADVIHLDAMLAKAELVLTGEGQVDAGSAGGKLLPALARRAANFGVLVFAFAGRIEGDVEALRQAMGLAELHAIAPPDIPVEEAMANTEEHLYEAVRRWYQSRL